MGLLSIVRKAKFGKARSINPQLLVLAGIGMGLEELSISDLHPQRVGGQAHLPATVFPKDSVSLVRLPPDVHTAGLPSSRHTIL